MTIPYRMVGTMARKKTGDRALSREAWTDAALTALADGGIDAVKVETLASSLAVTKGSFYWHFADRQDLLTAILDRWEERATTRIIEAADSAANDTDDPQQPFRTLAHLVFLADPTGARVETALRAWAAVDETAGQAVERIDARRLDYVARLLRRSGHTPATARRRARHLYRAMIGDFLWRTTGGPTISRSDLDDLVDLLTRLEQR